MEVLSPSSRHYDRDYKLEAYLRLGVAEVWLVDLDRRCIEVSAQDGRRLVTHARTLTWHPVAMPQALVLNLDDIFREVL